MRRAHTAAVVMAVGTLFIGSGARADDPARGADEPRLELRFHDVGALTQGNPWFIPERGPYPVPPKQVNDEDSPMFGGEGEDDEKPFGSIDQLIELIKSSTSPGAWEVEGTSIAGLGVRDLVVKATPDTQREVAAQLAQLEREALATVTVDVVVLTGDASSAAGEGGLAGAVAKGSLVPIASSRSCGFPTARIVGRQGGLQAAVIDRRTDLSPGIAAMDPVVGVQPDGVCFWATASRVTPKRLRLQWQGWWAKSLPTRVVENADRGVLEMFETDGREASADLDLESGVWALVPSTGSVVFAVRGFVRPAEAKPSTRGSAADRITGPVVRGPKVARRADVSDLAAKAQNFMGRSVLLAPSGYAGHEPPEMPEPRPAFAIEALVESIKEVVEPESWDDEGSSLEVHNGHLHMRARPDIVVKVEKYLDFLREQFLPTTRLKLTVATIPVASLPEYFMGLDDGATLLADGGAALLARQGAKVVDRAGLRLANDHRSVSVGGRERTYVADYDTTVAEKAAAGHPVVRSVFEGISLDVRVPRISGGGAVACLLRLDRSWPRGTRQVASPHGVIECPSLGIARMRGETLIPLGSTRLVGCNLEGSEVTLYLLTASSD